MRLFYKNKLFHVKLFIKYKIYMGISVIFLSIERFSLDKKNSTGDCERAYRGFLGSSDAGAYGTLGLTGLKPIARIGALDKGRTPVRRTPVRRTPVRISGVVCFPCSSPFPS